MKNMNNTLQVKIKKIHEHAVIPSYAKPLDAGLDLTVVSMEHLPDYEHIKYNFGIAIEIPEGYVGLVFPRSSIYKHGQLLSNAVGVIDAGYRGEISAVMLGTSSNCYQVGDRAAQLIIMPYPTVVLEEVEELSETERGEGSYGSTNN